jgi:hypothetical protein
VRHHNMKNGNSIYMIKYRFVMVTLRNTMPVSRLAVV